MYFIIGELLVISKIHSQVLHILNNCTKQQITYITNYAPKYLLSCIILWKFASELLFIFIHASTGHAHFSNDKIHISCKPDRPTSVFFNFQCFPDGKACYESHADSMSVVSSHTRFLAWKTNRSLLISKLVSY